MASSMNAAGDSLFYQKDYILTDASCYDNSSRSTIKNVLVENGALDVAFYYNKIMIILLQQAQHIIRKNIPMIRLWTLI